MIILAKLCLALITGTRVFAEEGAQKDISIEEFLQGLSTIKDVTFRKDPFAEMVAPFTELLQPEKEVGEDPNAPVQGAPVLEKFAIAEYEVVAVLLGDQYPRALLRLPGEGVNKKVVIVKENDKLGNRKGVISKIVLEGVIVQQAMRGAHGFVDKTEVLLKVGGKAEDQKKALQTKQSKNQ